MSERHVMSSVWLETKKAASYGSSDVPCNALRLARDKNRQRLLAVVRRTTFTQTMMSTGKNDEHQMVGHRSGSRPPTVLQLSHQIVSKASYSVVVVIQTGHGFGKLSDAPRKQQPQGIVQRTIVLILLPRFIQVFQMFPFDTIYFCLGVNYDDACVQLM